MVWVARKIHKISPLNTTNQVVVEGKFLNDDVFHILGHFGQTNKYNEIGCLLLIILEKVGGGEE